MNSKNKKESIKKRVLLVEGNHLNIRIMSRLLQSMDVDVVEAKNGLEALKFAVEESFSMIFMCGFMPEITGYKTTERIRETSLLNKGIPIIAVSSDRHNVLTDEMVECGISDIVSKPLKKDEIDSLFIKHSIKKSTIKKSASYDFVIFKVKDFESFYDDSELRKDIVITFINEKDNDIKKIKKAFKTNDIDKLYEAIHYMKGSFIYLKAQSLLELSQKILDLLKAKKLNEALILEETFLKKYDMLFKELSFYINNI